MLRISNYVFSTTLLGPYNRFAIWVDGCCFSCPGCLLDKNSHSTQKEISSDYLAFTILQTRDIEGITVSGGEPFLQAEELVKLIKMVKAEKDLGVIVYTGFTLEELQQKNDPFVDTLLNLTDILIDGRYMRELDDGKAYRGSSNQRIIPLTKRYSDVMDAYYDCDERKAEILVGIDYVSLVGVPDRDVLTSWKKMKSDFNSMNRKVDE